MCFMSNLGNLSNLSNSVTLVTSPVLGTEVTARLLGKKTRLFNNRVAFRAFRLPGYRGYHKCTLTVILSHCGNLL